MIFGKHVNKYYLKYGFFMLIGIVALAVVNWYQIKVPRLFGDLVQSLEELTGIKEEFLIDFDNAITNDHFSDILLIGEDVVIFYDDNVSEEDLNNKLNDFIVNLNSLIAPNGELKINREIFYLDDIDNDKLLKSLLGNSLTAGLIASGDISTPYSLRIDYLNKDDIDKIQKLNITGFFSFVKEGTEKAFLTRLSYLMTEKNVKYEVGVSDNLSIKFIERVDKEKLASLLSKLTNSIFLLTNEQTRITINEASYLIKDADIANIVDDLIDNKIINFKTNITQNINININNYQDETIEVEKTLVLSINRKVIKQFLIDFLIITLIMTIGRIIWRFMLMGTSRKIQHDMRKELFEHALKLDQPYFQTNKVGAIMSYFSSDIEAVRRSFGQGFIFLLDGFFLGVIVVIRMFNINAQLTLVSTIPMIVMGIVSFFIIRKMRKIFRMRQDSFEQLNDFTQESFSGIQVIKAFIKEEQETISFKEKSTDFYNKHMDYVKTSLWVRVVINIFINLTAITIVVFSVIIAIKNPDDLTTGNFIEFFSLFGSLIWPVMAFTHLANLRSQASASYSRLEKMYNAEPLLTDGHISTEVQGDIRFNNLTFAYPDAPNINVLENITVNIKKGESVGVLGRTGSGKTTFVDLLLRIYNVEKDMLYIDDIDIMDIKIKDVREGIAYVPQDNFLYSTTIKENIAFSSKRMTDDEVIEAAKMADIYDNVKEFKDGFETVLGERGTTVSGGQKQRISIARALAKESNVLIFDDSVSAVDTNTEETILANLKKIREGRTTIIIAHRISTVRKLDKIILLDQGKVVDYGTHDELMNRSKLYQEMVRRQTLESVVSGDA